MKLDESRRIGIAWMLLITIIFLLIVRDTHYHEEDVICCCMAQDANHVSHDNCLICHFMFLPFTVSELFHLEITFSLINEKLVYYVEQMYDTSVFPHDLRAPPIVIIENSVD